MFIQSVIKIKFKKTKIKPKKKKRLKKTQNKTKEGKNSKKTQEIKLIESLSEHYSFQDRS